MEALNQPASRLASGTPLTLILTGPTAVGKSRLAIELAVRVDGEVISADSMQVYRGMDIGTAKPSPKERATVPHHGLDLCAPDKAFHVGSFLTETRQALAAVRARHKQPIVCGGTGFYLRALCEDFNPVALPPDPALREKLSAWVKDHPGEAREKLKQVDPESHRRIAPNDLYRLVRALEVHTQSGKTLSQLASKKTMAESPFVVLCLQAEKSFLQALIEKRTDQMLTDGLIEEVRTLLAKGHAPQLAPLQSIGYKETIRFLKGDFDATQLRGQIVLHTRQLAKRQYTWFRKFARDWPNDRFYWLDTNGGIDADKILQIPGLRERLHYS